MDRRSEAEAKELIGRGSLALLIALTFLLFGAATASAQTPPALACGRIVAYAPPTATAAGSITLGTTVFSLKAASLPNPPPPNLVVGATVCMDENPAGEILAQTLLVGDTICGVLTAMTSTTITLQGNRTRIIAVRSGTSLAGAQTGANSCFNFGFNAAGDPEIIGFVGPASSGAGRAINVCGSLSALSPATSAQPAKLVIDATTYNLIGQGTITPPDISSRVGNFTHPLVRLTGNADGSNVTSFRIEQVTACQTTSQLPNTSTDSADR